MKNHSDYSVSEFDYLHLHLHFHLHLHLHLRGQPIGTTYLPPRYHVAVRCWSHPSDQSHFYPLEPLTPLLSISN